MFAATRRLLHRVVPTHFRDPIGLAKRLLRTGDPAAYFAMQAAAAGVATMPLDLALVPFERSLIARSRPRTQPIIFVCGAPRTGTTVVGQTLINHLPVAYFDNLTSVFPRSPLVATRLFGRWLPRPNRLEYHSYYGKSTRWSGPNDALYLWDRWLGDDREHVPDALSTSTVTDMRRFFDACEVVHGRPLLNKCNNLNTFAHLVADVLPEAHFVCMTRDPLYLAQSLFKARLDIHGDPTVAYGIADQQGNGSADDVYEDVCRQVLFHERTAERQRERVGEERFHIVRYEAFCRNPSRLVAGLREQAFGNFDSLDEPIAPFELANQRKVSAADFDRLAATYDRLVSEGDVERSPIPNRELLVAT